MRYLLNAPLALAAFCQIAFTSLVLMQGPWAGWEDGPSRGAMAYILIVTAAWALLPLLAAALAAALITDAFDGPPVFHGRRAALVLGTLFAAAAIAGSMAAAIGESRAVNGHGFAGLGDPLGSIAAIGGTFSPFVVVAWLFWLINAPPRLRRAVWPRRTALAALVLTAPGFFLGADALRQEIVAQGKLSAQYRQEEDKNEAENVANFASLTDDSPLSSWGAYATNNVYYAERFRKAQDEMRDQALKRIAARPTLEADLAKDLLSRDLYDSFARDSDIAFLLVARAPFAPSAALEAPIRDAMKRIVAEMRAAGPGKEWPGQSDVLELLHFEQFRRAPRRVATDRQADGRSRRRPPRSLGRARGRGPRGISADQDRPDLSKGRRGGRAGRRGHARRLLHRQMTSSRHFGGRAVRRRRV